MKNALFALILTLIIGTTAAQEADFLTGFKIFGSVDTYYKYDTDKHTNISSSTFTSDHNSISLGMIDLGIAKEMGKASFIGEISFGPRGQYYSILNGDGNPANEENSFHIQNLAISYAFTDKWSATAGFMGTFVGYEVISPTGNFHYSTSYLFGAGPFQNAGVKTTYAFTEKVSLSVGLYNDWNTYKDLNGVSHFGSQLIVTPTERSSFILNFLTGQSDGGKTVYSSGTLVDLVANHRFSDKVALGLNAADYTFATKGGYQGIALYPQYSFTPNASIGLRTEYFKLKETDTDPSNDITSFTLSAKLKHHGLSFIPEVRLDNSSDDIFTKQDLTTYKSNASQLSLALVYAF